MNELFLSLLDRSLSACYVVLAVVLLRLILKQAPKWLHCGLWALVAFRLLCPVSIESPFSVIPELSFPTVTAGEAAPDSLRDVPQEDAAASDVNVPLTDDRSGPAQGRTPLVAGSNVMQVSSQTEQRSWLSFALPVWFVGMAGMLGYAAFSFLRIRRQVSASIALGNGVFLCDYIDTPFILGVIHPNIFLPSEMDPNAAAHVLAHERAHLARRDHWWKPLGFLLLSLHWFNPVLWVAYLLLCRDIELACDERVVKDMAFSEKKEYSESLLKCSVPRHMVMACPLAFGEVGVKQRVKNVLHYKKPAFWLVAAAMAACALAAVCLLTDPQGATLFRLGEIRGQSVTALDFYSTEAALTVSDGRRLQELLTLLRQTRYDPARILSGQPETSEFPSIGSDYPYIRIQYGEETDYLCFSQDYNSAWYLDKDGTTPVYAVSNPQQLRQYAEDSVTLLKHNTITMKPFADTDSPWAWTQGVRPEALRLVRLYYGQNGSRGNMTYLPNAAARDVIASLNALPEDAITDGQFRGFDSRELAYGAPGSQTAGITLSFEDFTNDMTVVLRSTGTDAELILLDGRDWWKPNSGLQQNVTVRKIQNENLTDHLRELASEPPVLSTWLGSKYDVESYDIADSEGNASIHTYRLSDWVYEVEEPSADSPSFGIRCRPETEAQGWLYFSYWPEGYAVAESEYILRESPYAECRSVTAWPSGITEDPYFDYFAYPFSFKMNDYPSGDYVVVNEGADHWYHSYKETISDLQALTSFQYGIPQDEEGRQRAYGELTVDFSALETSAFYPLQYFDWDKMADPSQGNTLVLTATVEDAEILNISAEQNGSVLTFRFKRLPQGGFSLIT